MNDNIIIRVKSEDKAKIKKYCEKNGIDVSNFVRFLILQKVNEDLEKNKEENK